MDGDLSLIRNMLNNKKEQKEEPVFETQDAEIGNVKIFKDGKIIIDSKYSFKCDYNYNIPVSFSGFEYNAEELQEENYTKAIRDLKIFLNNKDQALDFIYKTVIEFFEGSEDYDLEDYTKIDISAIVNLDCTKEDKHKYTFINASFSFLLPDDEECGYADISFNRETLSFEADDVNYY